MPKIAIVTDSTAACTESMIGNVPVYSVPLEVVWGDEIFEDGVTLQPDEFYKRIKHSRVMPTTRQTSPRVFYNLYTKLLDEGYEILSMHISMGISKTINSAIQAKKMFGKDVPIEIHDSYVTAMVLKMLLIEAAQAIEVGKSLAQVTEIVKLARERSQVYFTVEKLDYLERGGRMTRMEAFAGNLFQLRPIFTFHNGEIVTAKKVLTYKGALNTLSKSCIEGMKNKQVRNFVATYTDNKEFVTKFYNDILNQTGIEKPAKAFIDPLSPSIGAHTGPGCIGLAFMLEE